MRCRARKTETDGGLTICCYESNLDLLPYMRGAQSPARRRLCAVEVVGTRSRVVSIRRGTHPGERYVACKQDLSRRIQHKSDSEAWERGLLPASLKALPT
jgi:hypothetical protein